MEELRIAFLLIGSLFIVGVLAHGMWKIRKQNGEKARTRQRLGEPTIDDYDDNTDGDESIIDTSALHDQSEDFDELGLGQVRVVSKNESTDHITDNSDEDQRAVDVNASTLPGDDQSLVLGEDFEPDMTADAEASEPDAPVYASVVTQPKPHMVSETPSQDTASAAKEEIPAPPSFLMKSTSPAALQTPANEQPAAKSEPVIDAMPEPESEQNAEPAPRPVKTNDPEVKKRPASKKRSAASKRKEPKISKFAEDQMRIDFDDPALGLDDVPEKANKPPQQSNVADRAGDSAGKQPDQEVLVINIRASDDTPLAGAALLPLLLTLGFKFGEHDIFHRHVNANGKGPILFSLANLVKPGSFDIDNLETFTTQGVSLFMVLPIEGDPHQVFNMMHNAARKIAEEFGASLLDGRRSVLTKQGVQQYVEKIREFERQRMIAKNHA